MKNSIYFDEGHEEIRKLARDFAEKELEPIAAEIDRTDTFPKEIVKLMGELGFFSLKIPEEYGGLGLDMRSYVCVMEEIAKKSAVATLFISSANSLSTAPIVLSGTEEQKKKYLPAVASGDSIIAFALTEPNAGSDAASIRTKAEKDGDCYVLNGVKCFITMAPIADYSIVYAKTDREKGVKGISCFIVDMHLPGVSTGKTEEKMGQKGVPVSDLVLEDVRVPADCLIGELNMGFINAMKTLSVGRIGVSAMCLGMAQEAMDLGIDFITQREQFGKTLSKMQALRFMIADMETRLNAAKLLTYHAAYLLDQGVAADQEASMAKYYTAENAIDIVNKSLQLHGGYGYSREYEIERIYRDVRVCSIYEGSSQVQQIVIAGKVLN